MPRRILEPITPHELQKILDIVLARWYRKKDRFGRIRDAMMITFCYLTGARPLECCRAKLSHLNLKDKTFFIPATSNKQRFSDTIPLQDYLVKGLANYMVERDLLYKDSEWLFPSWYGRPVDRSVLSKIFRYAVKEAGLQQISYTDRKGRQRYKYTLYNLRSSYATIIYIATDGNPQKIRIMLRHRDPSCRSIWHYLQAAQSLDRIKIMNEVSDFFKNH